MTKQALISGGAGDLARAIRGELEGCEWKVHAPGRKAMDVTSEESVGAWLGGLGELDLVVANAGCVRDEVLFRASESDWDEVMAVNLEGAARVARLVGGRLRRGGLLVFIGSHSAHHPPAGQVAYAAAKAALEGLTKSLAAEWGDRGVRVNLVEPGFLETKMTAGLSESVKDARRSGHVLGEFNRVEAVARFIRFLYEEMPASSGQSYRLDSRVG